MIPGWGLVHHPERMVLGCAFVTCVRRWGERTSRTSLSTRLPPACREQLGGEGERTPPQELWTEGPRFWRNASSVHLTLRFTTARAWLSPGSERRDHCEFSQTQKGAGIQVQAAFPPGGGGAGSQEPSLCCVFTFMKFAGRGSPSEASEVALVVKNQVIKSQGKRPKRHGFHPWVGRNPWRRAWQPTPVFLPGESHGQRSL